MPPSDKEHKLAYMIGHNILAPYFLSFTYWLIRQANNSMLNHLAFISRDGWIFYEIFKQAPLALTSSLTPHYIYGSTRSAWVSSLFENDFDSYLEHFITHADSTSADKILSYNSLDVEKHKPFLKQLGLSKDYVFRVHRDRKVLTQLARELWKDQVQVSQEERQLYLQYLQSKSLLNLNALGYVDVGWGGSAQKYMQNILHQAKLKIELKGFYFGVRKEALINISQGNQMKGFLFEPKGVCTIRESSLIPYIPLIELITQRPEAKPFRKIILHNGQLEPSFEVSTSEKTEYIKHFQKGVFDFTKAYFDSHPDETDYKLSPSHFAKLKRFTKKPTKAEAQLYAGTLHKDSFTGILPILLDPSLPTYLRIPKRLIQDYNKSLWKEGFKALLPLQFKFLLFILISLSRIKSACKKASNFVQNAFLRTA